MQTVDAIEIVLQLAQKSAVSAEDLEAIDTLEDFATNYLGDN